MGTLPTHSVESGINGREPWQLKLFRRSLKKQQKLAALLDIIGDVDGQECILVTCGDNNGALNWHFKRHGGRWTWADAEADSTEQIEDLTGDPVLDIDKDNPSLPLPDNRFDVVVTIDVHEHLQDPDRLNYELARIVKPNGRVIVTTPGGDQRKLANRVKYWLGMSTRDYGHVVDGYDVPELEAQLTRVGLRPVARSSYSRFFTEMLELMINFAYVKVLSKRSQAEVEQGQIAPQTKDQLKSVEKTYKIYSLAYPFLWAISKLDHLVRFRRGYAVIVAAQKA
jgi:SAM-dependent methyltransferase